MYVAWDRQSEAEAAFEKMLDEYSKHERLPHAIHEVAEECYKLGRADKGRQLCEAALGNRADSDQAVWVQMGVAISNNYCGNDMGVQTAFEQLVTDYAADERLAEAVGQMAWSCRKLKNYRRAVEFYQFVVDNCPDKERAIFSQRGVVLSHLSLGNKEAAWAAVGKLLSQFSRDENMAKVTSTVAEAYRNEREYEKARTLHQYVLDNHPDSDEAMWSQRSVALSCIGLGDEAGTQTAVDTLLTKFSGHARITRAVYQVARKLNNEEQARTLFQYITDNKPGDEHVVLAQANIGNIDLRLGNDAAARRTYDKMLSDFSAHPILPKAVMLVADGYYERAKLEEKQGRDEQARQYYESAIAECDRVTTEFSEVPFTTAMAWYHAAVCHDRVGRPESAIERYQKVVDTWPDFELASDALFQIGHTSQALKESGAMSKQEADLKTRAAYEQLLEKYPECNAAKAARLWLKRNK